MRVWIGKLDIDDWSDPIIDGFPLDLRAFYGKRVEILVRELGDDPESYENLAKSFDR
jgi:hypothetical protein